MSVPFWFSFQHRFKIGERIKRGSSAFAAGGRGIALLRLQLPLVFIVMAIHTQQFPVTAIGRIVAVIVVAVMHCQLMQILVRKLAAAAAANMRIHLQRLFAVTLFAQLTGAPRFSHHLIQLVIIRLHHTGHLIPGTGHA